MIKLPDLHPQLARTIAVALAVVGLATTPLTSLAQPAPVVADRAIEATFVNNHRENIEAMVWADGVLTKLGTLASGERRSFTLPPAVTSGARYYLLGDCEDGEWISSDPLTASAERHARFVVGRTGWHSYVRHSRVPTVAAQP